jgi:hypothetical protein
MGAGIAAAALGVPRSVNATSTEGAARKEQDGRHQAWVWRFDDDGSPEAIRSVLARHKLAVIVKANQGESWMGRWHKYPGAITGPERFREVAEFFEQGGVPFHAWCVVQGTDPLAEARLCSDVLDCGARSLAFDLEPKEGDNYWHGTRESALAFGRELRRLQPHAWLTVAPDPRPWQVKALPVAEFATFSNEMQPQTYWATFDSPANYRLMREFGFEVGSAGITPELILDVTKRVFEPFGLPVKPIGQGAASREDWQRFVSHAYKLGMEGTSVWRYGTATNGVWPLLKDMAPVATTSRDAGGAAAKGSSRAPERTAAEPSPSLAARDDFAADVGGRMLANVRRFTRF